MSLAGSSELRRPARRPSVAGGCGAATALRIGAFRWEVPGTGFSCRFSRSGHASPVRPSGVRAGEAGLGSGHQDQVPLLPTNGNRRNIWRKQVTTDL